MNDADLPTYLSDADRLARSICGEDYILIMPTHTSTDYVHGEYYGQDIVTAIHLPEENRSAINECVEWQPVELPQLAEKQ